MEASLANDLPFSLRQAAFIRSSRAASSSVYPSAIIHCSAWKLLIFWLNWVRSVVYLVAKSMAARPIPRAREPIPIRPPVSSATAILKPSFSFPIMALAGTRQLSKISSQVEERSEEHTSELQSHLNLV